MVSSCNILSVFILFIYAFLFGLSFRLRRESTSTWTLQRRKLTLFAQNQNRGGSWLPILSKAATPERYPLQIEVAGEKVVAWKNTLNEEWYVMKDYCPHRFAPLSQGRIVPETGCIECPYHGWQFKGSTGACVKIPQLDSKNQTIPVSATASYLPTYSTGDILWAFVDLPGGPASYFPNLPDLEIPDLCKLTNIKVRDLPYSFDYLVENFMDPAHIPFAHHKLQSVRSDGIPIPSQVITSEDNSTHCEVFFSDQVRGKYRNATVTFTAPCYFVLHVPKNNAKLIILCVPVAPGKSRVFVDFLSASRSTVAKFIPKWFTHGLLNRFLDSDLWLYDQERTMRNSRNKFYETPEKLKYVLPTASDTGPRAIRRWWQKHLGASPVFGEIKGPVPEYSLSEKFDWKLTHIRMCKHCQAAIRRAKLAQKVAPFLAAFLAAVLPNRALKVIGVLAATLMGIASDRLQRFVQGPEPGDLTSSSQMFPN